MNDWIQWLSFSTVAAAGLLLLWVGLLLLEWFRKSTHRRVARLFAVTFLVLALGGILLKPALREEAHDQVIILIGEQTGQALTDSLRKAWPGASLVASDTLRSRLEAELIILTGQGIPAHDLWKTGSSALLPVFEKTPAGMQALEFPKKIVAGEEMIIRGQVKGGQQDSLDVKLLLNGTKLDSVRTDSSGNFILRHVPASAGRYVYSISAGSGEWQQEFRMGAEAEEIVPDRVAVLLSYPTFESRALKNYLAENGMEVLVRQQISRDKFSYEFLNTEKRISMQITPDFLSELDLLIADKQVISTMGSRNREILERAMYEGMGLLVLASSDGSGDPSFSIPSARDSEGNWYFPENVSFVHTSGEAGRYRSGVVQKGRGALAASLESATYLWMLQGEEQQYQQYWLPLIDASVRKDMEKIVAEAPIMRVNQPTEFKIRNKGIPDVAWNGIQLPPENDAYLENTWKVRVWPADSGWHELVSGSDTSAFFIYGQKEFQAMKFSGQKRLIRQRAAEQLKSSDPRTVYDPVPAWIFYVLFLVAAGFLWLELKLG